MRFRLRNSSFAFCKKSDMFWLNHFFKVKIFRIENSKIRYCIVRGRGLLEQFCSLERQ